MLTESESSILRARAQGMTLPQIAERFKKSLSCVHTHCYAIRKKTGVKTKSIEACKNFLHGRGDELLISRDIMVRKIPGMKLPTQGQLRVLYLYAKGYDYKGIAKQLGLSPRTVSVHITAGCKTAGLIDRLNRRAHLANYISNLPIAIQMPEPQPMADPMFS